MQSCNCARSNKATSAYIGYSMALLKSGIVFQTYPSWNEAKPNIYLNIVTVN